LAVHTEGREVFLDSYDDPLGGATSFVSVLSLPFLLDGLVPQLAAALDKLPDSGAEAQSEAPADDASVDTASAGTRTVTHDLGETEVPANPQRIVAINSAAIELLATLGIKPVGIAPWIGAGNPAQVPAHISEAMDLSGVEFVGDANQPNLEAIAAVKPDLILMSGGGYYQELYDQVSQIAPTVAYAAWPEDSPRSYWKEYFINTATALGKEAEAQEVIDAWQARVAEFKAAAAVGEKRVSVTRLMPDQIMTYQKGSYSGAVLEDAGVKQTEGQEVVNFAETIPMEELPKIDGDILLLIQSDPQAAIYNQLLTSPLWQQLEAVQAEQVYLVNTDIWIGGDGYISANLILDDLERLFLEDGVGLTKAE
jgi:iron complex transport system substrate-binding protein